MTISKRIFLSATALTAILFTSAEVNAETISDTTFVKKASMSDMFEISSSKLALEKSNDDEIKGLAQNMIDDHQKSSGALKDALASSNSSIKPAAHLDASHRKMIEKLNSMSGQGFDSSYIMMQKNAHQEAVGLFSAYSATSKNDNLKEFADETLPILKGHLAHVKQLQTRH